MRVVAILLTVGVLLGSVIEAAAQTAPRPVPGGTPTNSASGGNSSNRNDNNNSQFLSGSNTGVNNGTLEIYAGSEPYQGIVFGGSTNLPQLPGVPSPPSNFSQPYRPDAFVNTPPFLPTEMTLEEAKRCRDAKASWYGGSREGDASSIRLFYAGKPETPSVPLTMANYVGTAMATTADGPFLAALCEAAYRALRKGATVGLVEFNVRPKNTMFGLGFGSSGGATGLPAAGAHPYAIAATLGFGTGWSNQRVEGEVVLQLTGLRGSPVAAAQPSSSVAATESSSSGAPTESTASTPAADVVTPTPADDAAAPGTGASSNRHDPSAAPRVLITAGQPAVTTTAQPAVTTAAQPAVTPTTPPAPSGPAVLPDPRPEPPAEPSRRHDSTVAVAAASAAPAEPSTIPSSPPPQRRAHHSVKRLASLRAGQSKDEVFGLFSSMFARRDQKIVEIQGMRLRASGQSARGSWIEVGEVRLADEASETLYWFLFSDGRLLAWGRPEQWGATATRYGVDLPYRSSPLHVEVKVGLPPGR